MSFCLVQTGYEGTCNGSDPQVLSLPTGGGKGSLQAPQPLAKTTFLLEGELKPTGPGSLWTLAWRSWGVLAPSSPEESSLVPSAQKMDSGQATGPAC